MPLQPPRKRRPDLTGSQRAAAIMVASLCIPSGLALAQSPPPATPTLPAGTRVDFVADDTINVETVRPGGVFRLHLAAPLVLGGAVLAVAGAPARLIVLDRVRRPDGTVRLHVGVDGFRLKAGNIPVAPLTPDISAVTAGMPIPAALAGSVERTPERIVIHVPVPVALPSSVPVGAYLALPAATTAPMLPPPRRGATPTPLPTTFNPDADPSPQPS